MEASKAPLQFPSTPFIGLPWTAGRKGDIHSSISPVCYTRIFVAIGWRGCSKIILSTFHNSINGSHMCDLRREASNSLIYTTPVNYFFHNAKGTNTLSIESLSHLSKRNHKYYKVCLILRIGIRLKKNRQIPQSKLHKIIRIKCLQLAKTHTRCLVICARDNYFNILKTAKLSW